MSETLELQRGPHGAFAPHEDDENEKEQRFSPTLGWPPTPTLKWVSASASGGPNELAHSARPSSPQGGFGKSG